MGSELISWLAVFTLIASGACLVFDTIIRAVWKPNLRWRRIISGCVVYAVSWLVLTGSIQIN